MTTRLPVVLESLRIAAPCRADWDEMTGDDRVRFCGQCEKNVYNLSAMSRAEAEALVAAREGRVCVRFYQRTDGTVLTADCPVGARRERLRARVWARVSGFAASAALLVGLATGRARADLTLKNGHTASRPEKGNTKNNPPAPKPPKPPEPPVMGEPMPLMGDISPPEPHKP